MIFKIILISLTESAIMEATAVSSLFIGLIFTVAAKMIYLTWSHLKVKKMEKEWNKTTFNKLGREASWNRSQIAEMKVGDIVNLSYCSVAPVDLLILDTSESSYNERVLKTNERKISGQNFISIKRSIRNLNLDNTKQNFHDSQYIANLKRSLNGFVQYSSPQSKKEGLLGSFKLKNDPKVTRIRAENILFCGSKLFTKEYFQVISES
jgi:magnesium-transporting ATPase (P-type)